MVPIIIKANDDQFSMPNIDVWLRYLYLILKTLSLAVHFHWRSNRLKSTFLISSSKVTGDAIVKAINK
jgi:hypothetical protein